MLLSREAEIGFGTHHDYSKYFATTAPGKERSVARIPDKHSRLAGVVLEYFGRADEASGTVSRKVDPYLETITLPHEVISIEVEGHHLAGLNDLAIESAQDIALAIDKRSAHNDGSVAGVRCR